MSALNERGPKKIEMNEWDRKQLPDDLASDEIITKRLRELEEMKVIKVIKIKTEKTPLTIIETRDYVGRFQLTYGKERQVILVVNPKIGFYGAALMLAVSEARELKEVRKVLNAIWPRRPEEGAGILAIWLAKKFAERLGEALIYGFAELPSTRLEEGVVVQGRIATSLLPRTLLASATPKVAYEVQYYTLDNVVNRYILGAARLLLEAEGISAIVGHYGVFTSALAFALGALDLAPSQLASDDDLYEALSEVPMDRPYLSDLLRLAYVIVRYLWGEPVEAPAALYMRMSELFENFVRRALSMAAAQVAERLGGADVSVRRAEDAGEALYLITKPRNKLSLKPDVVVELGSTPVAVGDVKYKLVKGANDLRPADVYQVYSYVSRWKVNAGFLVYPMAGGGAAGQEVVWKSYELFDKKRLYVLYVRVPVGGAASGVDEMAEYASRLVSRLADFLQEVIESEASRTSNPTT